MNSFNSQAQQATQGYNTLAQGAEKLKKSNEGVAASLTDLITGYLSFRGAQAALQGLQQIDQLGTQAVRTAFAFDELSGGANQAATNVLAIQRAGAGTIGALSAMSTGVQALSLNLASSAAEFGEITSAARAVALVSPVINNASDAIAELGLAASNLSYRRLDQLGLSVGEVKDRIGELKRENDGLDESAAFLQATVGLLNEKYGDLVNSAEAAATGQERLTVAFAEFGRLIATTDVARGVTEGFFGDWAGVLEAANVTFFGIEAGAYAVEKTLEGFAKTATDAFMPDAGRINVASEIIEEINNAAIEGKPGIEGYQQQALAVAASIVKWGSASEEQIRQLREIQTITQNLGTPNDPNSFQPGNNLAVIQARRAAEEQRAAAIFEQQSSVNGSLDSAAKKSVGTIGLENALSLLKQQKALVDQAITELVADATIVNPDEIALRIAEIQQGATQAFADAAAALPEVDASVTAESFGILGQALADLNQGFVDFLPSTAALRDDLITLSDEIAYTGVTTEEQAAQLQYLAEAAAAVGNEQSLLTAVTSELGVAFLSQNEAAAATVDAMYQAQSAYLAGQLTAVQYAGVMAALGGQLLSLASDAGVATGAILALNAAQGGAAGLPGFAQGQAIGGGVAQRIQTQQAQRDREASRKAAERAAKEAEAAAKRAGREAESAAKRAGKALESAAKKAADELKSALKSVPGLFGRSPVTKEQIDLAKQGVPQNFADDYLRRLEDEVFNNKDWADVSIEEAKAALAKIGITASENNKAAFEQFAQAWDSSALFADKENLSFINQEAVKLQLDLQEKAKQGQANIYELFGIAVDEAVESIGSGISGGGVAAVGGGISGTGEGITIPVKGELIPMTAGDTASAGGGTFAITPMIDTQAIQDQLDLLTLPPFEVTAMGLADLQTQIDTISPSIKIKSSLDGESFAALFEKVQSTKPTIAIKSKLNDTDFQDFLTKVESTKVSLTPIFTATPTNLSELAVAVETQAQISIPVGLYSTLETMQELATIVGMTKISIPVSLSAMNADGSQSSDIALGFVGELNRQFDTNANFFYAAGQGPAGNVLNGYKGFFGTASNEGAPLATPLVTAINTQIRMKAEDFKNQGVTIAQYVQAGVSIGFNSESFKAALVSVGESLYASIRTGLINAADGGDLVESLGAKILADLTVEVEAP